jgi:hypothetical protein
MRDAHSSSEACVCTGRGRCTRVFGARPSACLIACRRPRLMLSNAVLISISLSMLVPTRGQDRPIRCARPSSNCLDRPWQKASAGTAASPRHESSRRRARRRSSLARRASTGVCERPRALHQVVVPPRLPYTAPSAAKGRPSTWPLVGVCICSPPCYMNGAINVRLNRRTRHECVNRASALVRPCRKKGLANLPMANGI